MGLARHRAAMALALSSVSLVASSATTAVLTGVPVPTSGRPSATVASLPDVASYVSGVASFASDVDGSVGKAADATQALSASVDALADDVAAARTAVEARQAAARRAEPEAEAAEATSAAARGTKAETTEAARDASSSDVWDGVPESEPWASDASYRSQMEGKAARHGSDTDWSVTFDCDLCCMCVLHRDDGGAWSLVAGWECAVGPLSNGRSLSMSWGHLTKVTSKWPDSGNGPDVNPWKLSLSENQHDFGWHGTWGNLDEYLAAYGTHYCTGGDMVIDNGPAEWTYDNLPIGTEVIVFDSVDPK